MTKKILASVALTVALVALVPSAEAAIDSATRKSVLARVQTVAADVKWNAKAIETLEFNCDGQEDYVIGGRAGNRFYIAVVTGPLSIGASPLMADFPAGTDEDGALCEKAPKLFIGSMGFNPGEMLSEMPAGFVQSATCNEIDLGGECAKYHIYWNAEETKIGWWK